MRRRRSTLTQMHLCLIVLWEADTKLHYEHGITPKVRAYVEKYNCCQLTTGTKRQSIRTAMVPSTSRPNVPVGLFDHDDGRYWISDHDLARKILTELVRDYGRKYPFLKTLNLNPAAVTNPSSDEVPAEPEPTSPPATPSDTALVVPHTPRNATPVAGHISTVIVILGMGDSTSFRAEQQLQYYVRGGVMSNEGGRFRYTKQLGQDPRVIVLTYNGFAYGHFVVHKGRVETDDVARYPGTKSVYLVEELLDYAKPVKLSGLGILIAQAPKYISEKDLKNILMAAGQATVSYDGPSKESQRRRVLREIAQRQGQGQFRDAVLTAYGRRCAITGCDIEQGLDAAHIRPYAREGSDQISNGLLLRSDIHNLFDFKLLAIDPKTLLVHLNERLDTSTYTGLQNLPLKTPVNPLQWPDVDALEERWGEFKNL